ncbi:HNH endonuclease [Actimicrobium antarcticum]|uniref:HNH endonuclease n=1 Tax=Actimicrobium antarcticum TaxID=1051899 RepID=UPI003CD062DD
MVIWDSQCAVTSCGVSETLIASHTQAWAHASNEARLDPFNGFLLVANLDRLFDQGLISFADDG